MAIFKKPTPYLIIIFFVIAVLYNLIPTCSNLIFYNIQEFKYFFGKSTDEKYKIIDGDFYDFILFCKDKIPPYSEALFYNSFELYKRQKLDNALYRFSYERQKSRYYLYPIRVHTFFFKDEILGLPRYSEKELLDKAEFIIDYSTNVEFPGFEVAHIYGHGDIQHRILKKIKDDE